MKKYPNVTKVIINRDKFSWHVAALDAAGHIVTDSTKIWFPIDVESYGAGEVVRLSSDLAKSFEAADIIENRRPVVSTDLWSRFMAVVEELRAVVQSTPAPQASPAAQLSNADGGQRSRAYAYKNGYEQALSDVKKPREWPYTQLCKSLSNAWEDGYTIGKADGMEGAKVRRVNPFSSPEAQPSPSQHSAEQLSRVGLCQGFSAHPSANYAFGSRLAVENPSLDAEISEALRQTFSDMKPGDVVTTDNPYPPYRRVDELHKHVTTEELRLLIRSELAPRRKLFAVHVNSGQASFVKDFDYYESSGGMKQEWGKSWRIVLAHGFDAVRLFAMKSMGAREDALYCSRCGASRHGDVCTRDVPPPAIEVPKDVAFEEWCRVKGEGGWK